MARGAMRGTQWFALSGRELLTLIVGVGLVLVAVAAMRLAERAWGRADVAITESGDVLPPPARLNVNEAEDFELILLPGIGPKTAQAITEYREQHGPFASLDDLKRVSGIGPATVERIRPHAMCAPVTRAEGED